MPALFWAWSYAQPHYSAAVASAVNVLLAAEEAGERVTTLRPGGEVIAVWSTLRDDGEPANSFNAEVLHFYLVLCVAFALAFPEPRGWRRLRLLGILLAGVFLFHVAALLVTVEHTYAVELAEVARRNYSAAESAVYRALFQTFAYFAVQLVPAATLIGLFATHGFGLRIGRGLRAAGAEGEPEGGEAPARRGGRVLRLALAAGAAVIALAGVAAAGWAHAGNIRARQAEALCARGFRILLDDDRRAREAGEAARMFREAVRLKPPFVEAWEGLGEALRAAGRPGDAVEGFRGALALEPQRLSSLTGLANTLLAQGKVDEAAEVYRRAIGAHPDRWEPRYNLARALLPARRYEEAEPELARAVELNPTFPDARIAYARLLAQLGRRCEALPHLEAFLALDPGSRLAEAVQLSIEQERPRCEPIAP